MDHLESLPLEGGGSLEYCVSDSGGAADWLFFHVGTPSAAVLFPHMTEAAARRGIQIVTYSRGGYGRSTRNPARAVAQEARNTAALADHLGIATFHVVGWSGGGSSALACAAHLPERVRSCVVLASSSPREEVGPEWFGWHDPGYVEELRTLAFGSPETYRQAYVDAAGAIAKITVPRTPRSPKWTAKRSRAVRTWLTRSRTRGGGPWREASMAGWTTPLPRRVRGVSACAISAFR